MKLRNRTWFGLILLLLAALATGFVLLRQQHLRDAERRFTGTLSYTCGSQLRSENPPVLLATEMILTEHRDEGRDSRWTVQAPGEQPVATATYAADIGKDDFHPIGGSLGLRWRTKDGRLANATLSFSDMIGRYGPDRIGVEFGERMLVCLPDEASYRPAS